MEKIILFGSVARGDDEKESDIDIFILTKNKEVVEEDIRDKSFDLSIENSELISTIIVSNEYYEEFKHFSFFKNLEKEGILIG
ncbi:MAG: nucleotidyltransferase domain-containing protein [Methanobrevibacter sp.]|nr:nucleotidyltransferase domain-containing protein [Candidatus Methanoflexus mossambicus]